MRLPLAAALIPLLSCGEPTPSMPPAPDVAAAVVEPPAMSYPDDPFLAWAALGLTGANHEATLAGLPSGTPLRGALATYLIEAGGFECEEVDAHDECGDTVRQWRPLAPAADFFDPCLRRRLALWSLSQLDVEDAAGLADALAELVTLPEPEQELQGAALDLAAGNDALLLALLRLAEPELAELHAIDLDSDEARLIALRELHLDSVVDLLDPAEHRATLLEAMTDDELELDTRRALVEEFARDPGADVAAALVEVAGDLDCGLAMLAALALADRGDRAHLPRRPRSLDPEAHLAAMCMQSHDELELLAAWLPRAATRVDSQEGWPDEDGEDRGVSEDTTRIAARDADAAFTDIIEALGAGGASCNGLTCSLASSTSDLTITFARSGRSLVVAEIAQHHYSGCGC